MKAKQSMESAFVESILREPSDATLRLIYADWLEDNCQDRKASVIRDAASKVMVSSEGNHCYLSDAWRWQSQGPIVVWQFPEGMRVRLNGYEPVSVPGKRWPLYYWHGLLSRSIDYQVAYVPPWLWAGWKGRRKKHKTVEAAMLALSDRCLFWAMIQRHPLLKAEPPPPERKTPTTVDLSGLFRVPAYRVL